ncbi:MAG: hypothetical protein QXS37_05415 [Candidatus Aenigmatarchaeota archaeon]
MNEKSLVWEIEEHEIRIKKLEEKVEELERKIKDTTISSPRKEEEKTRTKTLSEFLKEKKPKKDTDITLCIGYYLQVYEKKERFSTEDVKKGYKRARRKLPKNISDKIQLNIKKGFIDEYPSKEQKKKYWYVTESGKRYVEELGDKNERNYQ